MTKVNVQSIDSVLSQYFKGNISAMARHLNITKQTVYNMLARGDYVINGTIFTRKTEYSFNDLYDRPPMVDELVRKIKRQLKEDVIMSDTDIEKMCGNKLAVGFREERFTRGNYFVTLNQQFTISGKFKKIDNIPPDVVKYLLNTYTDFNL